MKTYILNLPSANERRDFQLLQAEKLGLDAVLISAVTPRDIPVEQFQHQAFMWERPLKITEVACFLSHYGVWEIIAQGNEPALVLEDDAMLARNTPQLLKFLEEIKNVEYVCLETRLRKKMIGNNTIIGASSVVMRNTEDENTYFGNPAVKILKPKSNK